MFSKVEFFQEQRVALIFRILCHLSRPETVFALVDFLGAAHSDLKAAGCTAAVVYSKFFDLYEISAVFSPALGIKSCR